MILPVIPPMLALFGLVLFVAAWFRTTWKETFAEAALGAACILLGLAIAWAYNEYSTLADCAGNCTTTLD